MRDEILNSKEFKESGLEGKTLRQLAGVFDFPGWPRHLAGDLNGDFVLDTRDYEVFRATLGKRREIRVTSGRRL